jgi:hypothetical protein
MQTTAAAPSSARKRYLEIEMLKKSDYINRIE